MGGMKRRMVKAGERSRMEAMQIVEECQSLNFFEKTYFGVIPTR
jgi:hypothetical protein